MGVTTISTHVVVIPTSSDLVTTIPVGCLWVSTIIAVDTIGEVVLIRGQQCSNLWLPIGILCGVECGCKYISSSLFLV
jgi:hypothetical protein